jgi:hypothetical protein
MHHQNLGFSHIYIYDHRSIIPVKDILKNVTNITVKSIDDDIRKCSLMIKAYRLSLAKKYDLMIYLDSDEFLILNKHNNVNDFLNLYKNYDQIGINWLLFGSNNLNKKLNSNQTIIESYTKCQKKLNMHIKSFLNLKNENIKIRCPHVFLLQDISKSVDVDFNCLGNETPHFNRINKHYNDVTAYIAHYMYQSYETYIQRKVNLPRDDTNTYRKVVPKENFHKAHNDEINLGPLNKYNEINKKKIKEIIL